MFFTALFTNGYVRCMNTEYFGKSICCSVHPPHRNPDFSTRKKTHLVLTQTHAHTHEHFHTHTDAREFSHTRTHTHTHTHTSWEWQNLTVTFLLFERIFNGLLSFLQEFRSFTSGSLHMHLCSTRPQNVFCQKHSYGESLPLRAAH